MHYLIDGYNLLFRLIKNAGEDLQGQRQRIISDLNVKAEFLGIHISIIFDAYYQSGDEVRTHYRNLEILFTAQGQTADEFILQELAQARKPLKRIVVVTSDKQLAYLTRRSGAHSETVEKFVSWLNNRFSKKLLKKKEPVLEKKTKKLLLIDKKKDLLIPIEISPEKSFDYYLSQFEAAFKEILKKDISPINASKKTKSRKPIKKKIPKMKEDIWPNERWLRIFEERFEDIE